MFSILKGKCYLCRQEKSIPIARDGYGICADCDQKIEADFDSFNTIECSVCFKQFSPLWGKFSEEASFTCHNCLPEGICRFCSEPKRLPFMGQDENGYFLFCRDCNEEIVSSI